MLVYVVYTARRFSSAELAVVILTFIAKDEYNRLYRLSKSFNVVGPPFKHDDSILITITLSGVFFIYAQARLMYDAIAFINAASI